MKTLGIIGGLGPMATAMFLRRIVEMTDAKTDQEHLCAIIFNRPDVPDRTACILDPTKPSPVPAITKTAQTLARLGADYLAVPCVTSHAFFGEIAKGLPIPLINMVTATAESLKAAGMKKTGIMATTGTVQSALFQQALLSEGIAPMAPDSDIQTLVMELIYHDIKAGKPADMQKFARVSQSLFDGGCDSIILGCTELSVIHQQEQLGAGFIDALDVLAQRCIQLCEKPLKPAFEQLIVRHMS